LHVSTFRSNAFARDVNKDSRLKNKDKDKDLTFKDKDKGKGLEFKDRKQGLLT